MKQANQLKNTYKRKFLFHFRKFSCDINCTSVAAVKNLQNQILYFSL